MKQHDNHVKRIRSELAAAGVTRFGMMKFSIRYLPEAIHEGEHIGGLVYGRYKDKSGSPKLNEGLLVATDRRIIFLDHKPGYTSIDELTYQVVSGVQKSSNGISSTVTLNTRITNFELRFVNRKCADIFIDYVEKLRLESSGKDVTPKTLPNSYNPEKVQAQTLNQNAQGFLRSHETAVLSTIDRAGNIHGAVIYYTAPQDGLIYILTKAETNKAHNILAHNQIALTIYDEAKLQTLQIQGQAFIEPDPPTKQRIFNEIVKPREYEGKKQLPPVSQLKAGAFMVLKIVPTGVKFQDFKQS